MLPGMNQVARGDGCHGMESCGKVHTLGDFGTERDSAMPKYLGILIWKILDVNSVPWQQYLQVRTIVMVSLEVKKT